MQLLYGNGGNAELPSPEEANVVEGSARSAAYTLDGDSTATSPTLASVADTSLVEVGDTLYGPGWNAGAVVLSKTSNSITFTTNADHTVAGGSYAGVRDGSLNACIVMLVKAVASKPLKELTFADLTVCDFDGYANSGAVDWSTPLYDADGNAFITGDKKQFRATGGVTANSVIGAALVDAGLTTLYQFDRFVDANGAPSPVPVEGVGTGLDYVPLFSVK